MRRLWIPGLDEVNVERDALAERLREIKRNMAYVVAICSGYLSYCFDLEPTVLSGLIWCNLEAVVVRGFGKNWRWEEKHNIHIYIYIYRLIYLFIQYTLTLTLDYHKIRYI